MVASRGPHVASSLGKWLTVAFLCIVPLLFTAGCARLRSFPFASPPRAAPRSAQEEARWAAAEKTGSRGLQVVWSRSDVGKVKSAAVGDVDKDGEQEVAAAGVRSGVRIVSAAGHDEAVCPTPPLWGDMALADLGKPVLLSGGDWSEAVVGSDQSGSTVWQYPVRGGDGVDDFQPVTLSPGKPQAVLIGFNGFTGVHLVDSKGNALWQYKGIGNVWSVAAGDLNGDGSPEMICCGALWGGLQIIDVKGRPVREVGSDCSLYKVAAADLDGDGKVEISAVGDALRQEGVIYAIFLDNQTRETGRVAIQGNTVRMPRPVPGDVLGAGVKQWVLATKPNEVSVVSRTGKVLVSYVHPTTVNSLAVTPGGKGEPDRIVIGCDDGLGCLGRKP